MIEISLPPYQEHRIRVASILFVRGLTGCRAEWISLRPYHLSSRIDYVDNSMRASPVKTIRGTWETFIMYRIPVFANIACLSVTLSSRVSRAVSTFPGDIDVALLSGSE